jgi:hypothetical protein
MFYRVLQDATRPVDCGFRVLLTAITHSSGVRRHPLPFGSCDQASFGREVEDVGMTVADGSLEVMRPAVYSARNEMFR